MRWIGYRVVRGVFEVIEREREELDEEKECVKFCMMLMGVCVFGGFLVGVGDYVIKVY
jgi:hypothetical protein